ncbi:protein angel homolog 2 isoform X2 [Anabas testudineus]|nr:protein angel homolog 2 isoform X2 [Anabas testudineus]XP_026197806.1 protein angel homolog 2 isoform X2 [Anabas testudineus]
MFLSQLSSSSSSFLPRSHLILCRAGFKSSTTPSYLPHFIPAPRPWSSVRGFPPWHPRLHHSYPPAQQVFTIRTSHHQNINPGILSDRCRSFYTTASLMTELPHRDRGPPYKRRKSTEEKRNAGEREGHRAAVAGATESKVKDGRREHQHQDPSTSRHPQPNQHFRDGSRHRGTNGAEKEVSRETIRDKDVERTKYWNKNRSRKDSTSHDETQHRRRTEHQQGGCKDSQTGGFRTQTHKSRPEQDAGYMQKPKPNPWFKDRSGEKQVEHHRNTRPEEKLRDKSGDRGQGRGFLTQPSNTIHPSNPWRVAEANKQPPPPGTSPPDRQQDEATPVKPLQRHWETSPDCSAYPQPPESSTAFDFSVMSYNILSQELLQDNVYLYKHCNPCILPWEYRLPNLLAEIQQHDADILCLQEVQEDHYENQIKPALQALGYHCEYKKRTGSKPDGCAIIFKSSRLSLLSSNPVEFFRPGDAVLDRDNVGMVVLLRPNTTMGRSDPSAFICVANTHLLYNPRRGDIKLSQLAILLAEIRRLSRLPDGMTNPVVLCGDFNSTPWSPLYTFLTTGCLEYRGLPTGMVSGQENPPRGHRLLTPPIWSQSLGINHRCQYENKDTAESSPTSPRAVEGAISNLTVEDLATKAAAAVLNRAKIEHGLKLQSSYQHRLMPDGRPEITTCHSRTAITVDYILFTPVWLGCSCLPRQIVLHPATQLSAHANTLIILHVHVSSFPAMKLKWKRGNLLLTVSHTDHNRNALSSEQGLICLVIMLNCRQQRHKHRLFSVSCRVRLEPVSSSVAVCQAPHTHTHTNGVVTIKMSEQCIPWRQILM